MGSHLFRSDDGYSIAELMMTLALLGVVITAAYGLVHVAGVSAEQSDSQAWIATEIGKPLDSTERMFTQQAPPMEQTERYLCEIRTDQDRDNNYEFHLFEATAGGLLTETFYEQADNPTPRLRTWSRANFNRAASTPMFTYFDIEGTDISAETPTFIQRYAVSIEITIVTEHNGQQFADSRRIFFRNR